MADNYVIGLSVWRDEAFLQSYLITYWNLDRRRGIRRIQHCFISVRSNVRRIIGHIKLKLYWCCKVAFLKRYYQMVYNDLLMLEMEMEMEKRNGI